jgi:hypothetical protein
MMGGSEASEYGRPAAIQRFWPQALVDGSACRGILQFGVDGVVVVVIDSRIARRNLHGFDAQFETDSSSGFESLSIVDRLSSGWEKFNDFGVDRF